MNSEIAEHYYKIKILLIKKLRADWTQGMLAIVRCRIFRLTLCQIACFFVRVRK